ncbi:MAG: GGDEF domain-containing protein [Nitrospirae bacterium]|nr:GGDEF domain-containing protein [Nitrospirota bacterium]
MMNRIRQMIGTAATVMDLAYKLSQGLDYKILNKYILKINRLSNVEEILCEASQCLNDILNYEIFAFGLKHNDRLDVWIDPKIDDKRLIQRIQTDLACQSYDVRMNYFRDDFPVSSHLIDSRDLENLLTFDIHSDKYAARLYILPGRKMFRYHAEIIDSVMNAVSSALENSLNIQQLESAAFIDILTGCYNRRALNSYIDHDIADAQRYGRDLSVIMIDIDYFKRVNDTYGHEAGDSVLSVVSKMVSSTVRKSDYLARYGGEEFVLVLPNTGLLNAADLAERLRKKVEACVIDISGQAVSVTASFGVATLKEGHDRTQLLLDADRMLYRAKGRGRNRVMHEKFSFMEKGLFLKQAVC